MMNLTTKKLLHGICYLVFITSMWSCYDDSDLRNSVEDLQARVRKLEAASTQAQGDITALQAIVSKLEKNVSIDKVETNPDGYKIYFTDGTSAVISNGTDGITPPQIVVEQFEGHYYWAYKDASGKIEFITDDKGAKIPVKEAAPKVRINPQTYLWEISQDNGITWVSTDVKALGEDAQSFFEDVREDENYVYFTLSGGSEIRVPKSKELKLKFDIEGKLYFQAGETKTISYQESGIAKKSVSRPDGWKVEFANGNIEIIAPRAENSYADQKGVISIVAVGVNGQSIIEQIEVEIGSEPAEIGLKIVWTQGNLFFTDIHLGNAEETGAEELNPSNTFLVRPGKKYRFKTNLMGRGSNGVSALGLTQPTQTLGGLTIREDATINPSLIGESEYVYFTTYDQGDAAHGGVGIVSITLNGKAAWSWMIWARNEDPADEQIGEQTFMSVNLGSYGPHLIRIKLGHSYFDYPFAYYYGLPYSWGASIPQPGLTSLNKAISALHEAKSNLYYIYEYNESGTASELSLRRPGYTASLSEAIRTPFAPASLVGTNTDEYANLWGHTSGQKTIFDPCPYGYRVATQEVFKAMQFGLFGKGGIPCINTASGTWNYLLWGGLLTRDQEANTPIFTDVSAFGYYWTNAPSVGATIEDTQAEVGPAYSQMFRVKEKGKEVLTTSKRENGALVRCIRYTGEL